MKAALARIFVFSALAWPGGTLACLLAGLAFCTALGAGFGSGFTAVLGGGLGLLAALLMVLAAGALLLLLGLILAHLPWKLSIGALGSFAAVALLLRWAGAPGALALGVPLALLGTAAGLGGSLSALVRGWGAGLSHRLTAAGVLLASLLLACILALPFFLGGEPFPRPAMTAAEAAPDAAKPGLWKTATLTYGPGQGLSAPSEDLSRFLPGVRGLTGLWDRWSWGYGPRAVPLAGRVTWPVGKGPFPLVVGLPGDGLGHLGELLASRGFIYVAAEGRFLGGPGTGDGGATAGAWLLLRHLERLRTWSQTPGNPFEGRIDPAAVALVGHGAGGAAAIQAAALSRMARHPSDGNLILPGGLAVQAVAVLAPTDAGQALGGLEDIHFLQIQGSHDPAARAGVDPWPRVRLTGNLSRFKAALWLHRADGAAFAQGGRAPAPPLAWFLDAQGLLAPADQRAIGRACVSSFLEAALHGRMDHAAPFRDPRGAVNWLPRCLLFSRYEESGFRPLSGSAPDLARAATAAGVQRGEGLDAWTRHPSGATALAWTQAPGRSPVYTLVFPPPGDSLSATARLVFTLSPLAPGEPWPDLTLELAGADGVTARLPLSKLRPLPPRTPVRLTLWSSLDAGTFPGPPPPTWQTFEVPLVAFKEVEPLWSPRDLQEVRFRFDRTPRGGLLVDQVGFRP